MDMIIMLHNGAPSPRAVALKLREAELAGDMDAYQALLRLPAAEIVLVQSGDPFAILYHRIDLPPPADVPLRMFLGREQHYRDLEFRSQGRKAQVLRSRSRR